MTKFEIFKEKIQIAVNFFDVFNESFEPLKMNNELSSCHLLITKKGKKFPQRVPTKLQKIKELYFPASRNESERFKKKSFFAVKFFTEYLNLNSNNFSEQNILSFFFRIIQDYHNVKKYSFMDSMYLDDFEKEIEYFLLEEQNYNYYLERFLTFEDKYYHSNEKDENFLRTFFEEIFLHNFFVSICYLVMNFIFFINCFNDQILKKYMSGGKDETGISITNLITCQEFLSIKECAKEVIHNSGDFYSRELFNKYNRTFLITLSDIFYLDAKSKYLLFSNNNLGYEKVNFVLGSLGFLEIIIFFNSAVD
jgi:hypothetical protein